MTFKEMVREVDTFISVSEEGLQHFIKKNKDALGCDAEIDTIIFNEQYLIDALKQLLEMACRYQELCD